jgi:hypothetical protein
MVASHNHSNFNATSTMIFSSSSVFWVKQFWIMLFSNVLSIICCLFVLFYIFSDRILRNALHNHVVIIVLLLTLICELTDIPWLLFFYRWGVVWLSTPTFCLIWKYIDIVIFVTSAKLIAWASIERHILIFHDRWLLTKTKRLFIHYLPVVAIVTYCVIYYALTICIFQCDQRFYYNTMYCSYTSCVYRNPAVIIFEFISGGIFCSLIIALFSITLVIRVVRQKRRVHQPIRWRKHRKLAIQLLFITSLFYVLYLPPVVLQLARMLGMPYYVGFEYSIFVNQFFTYYIQLLFPFACLGILPQLRTRMKNFTRRCCRWQARAVGPQQFPMRIRTSNRLPE